MLDLNNDQTVAYLYQEIMKKVDKEIAAAISGGVSSVNGKTGAVSLTAEDVGALPNTEGAVGTVVISDTAVTPAKLDRAYGELDAFGRILPEQLTSFPLSYLGDRTLALVDAGKLLLMVGATAQTITIPNDADVFYPLYTEIKIVQWGAGAVTFSPATGVAICSFEGKTTIAGIFGAATLKKMAENIWLLEGLLA